MWLAKDRSNLNPWLDGIAVCGLVTAISVFILGAANLPMLFTLWLCQKSLWAVGGPWYGYAWEMQLAELGFHALFMAPLFLVDQFDVLPVPVVVRWTMQWFLFRIMMGAGLTKIKGGREWKELTAMVSFYETQPCPNPFLKHFHSMPRQWHRGEVLTNHFVELIAPFLLLSPFWRVCIIGGAIQVVFQAVLIPSGNLSFLNWLTAVPAILCFDDAFFSPFFSENKINSACVIHQLATASPHTTSIVRVMVNVAFGSLVARLSVPVVRNLCARRQIMNGLFDPLCSVNTCGAFGTVQSKRIELIVSGSMNATGEWRECEFPIKPGNVEKTPCWISPHHCRLDWQLWIASLLGSVERSPWTHNPSVKLLERDQQVMSALVANDPWKGKKPKCIRIDRHRYHFLNSKPGQKRPYWQREHVGWFYPRQGVRTADDIKKDSGVGNDCY